MANHAMFRADNLAGTTLGKYLVSLRVTADIDNGAVVVPGDYEDGAREVREYATPEASSALGTIAIIGSEEVNNDVKYDAVADFVNKSGDIARGYILTENDIFSVTAEAIDGTASVGSIIELQAGTKLKAVASATASTTTIGKCVAVEQDGSVTWYVIRVGA